jgi:hypothetical protein
MNSEFGTSHSYFTEAIQCLPHYARAVVADGYLASEKTLDCGK